VSDSHQRIWFSSFVLVVFCLGGIAGYRFAVYMPGKTYLVGGPSPGPGREGPGFGGPGLRRGGGRPGSPFGRGPGGPPPLPPEIVNRLSSELELDAAQRDQVKQILDDRRDRLEAVHREARERFDKEQRDLHAAIRAVLRADQQSRFDRFLDRRE
jgi:hypothetical protein